MGKRLYNLVNTREQTIFFVFWSYFAYDEWMNSIDFNGNVSNVKVIMSKYWINLNKMKSWLPLLHFQLDY